MKWPKRKNIGTTFTNNKGVTWRWNGKGWILVKNDIYQSLHSHHIVSTYSVKFEDISIGQDYIIELNQINSGKITQIDIMSKWRNYIPLENKQSFRLVNVTKNIELELVSDFSHLQNNQVDNFLLKTPLLVEDLDEIKIKWNIEKLTNIPHSIEFDFHIHIES